MAFLTNALTQFKALVYVDLVDCSVRVYMVPVIPPLTEIHCALIHRLFSDASRSVASAKSSGAPRRFAARVCSNRAVESAVGDPSDATRYGPAISVGTGPGATVLTVIPRLLPSCPPLH